MVDETLELQILQYLDGELPEEQVAALETRLAEDPEAAAVLEQHRKLLAALTAPAGLAEVKWDVLKSTISDTIADEEAAARRRIGAWVGTAMRLAIAATFILALGMWVHYSRNGSVTSPASDGVAVVSGPTPQIAAGPAVAEIRIGPPTAAQRPNRPADWYAFETIVTRPTVIEIASSAPSGADSDLLYR